MMGTNEVMRKTLALAQAQLSNYKMTDANRTVSGSTACGQSRVGKLSSNKAASTVSKSR
jgi:hypothetical protein